MSDESTTDAAAADNAANEEVDSNASASNAATSNDAPPDRLSIVPTSKYYDEELLKRGVAIRFNGVERTNVQEYSISEGWVTMVAGKKMDRYGRPLTVKSKGKVEAWYEDPETDESADDATEPTAD